MPNLSRLFVGGGHAILVPSFPAVGSVVKYKTTGAAATVFAFADCCVAGDMFPTRSGKISSRSSKICVTNLPLMPRRGMGIFITPHAVANVSYVSTLKSAMK